MASIKFLGLLSTVAVLATASVVAMAGPESRSPFARKKPKAWQQQPSQTGTTLAEPGTHHSTQPSGPSQTLAGGAWAGSPVRSPQVRSPRVSGPQVSGPDVQGPTVTSPNVTAPKVSGPQVRGPQVPAWANKTYSQNRKQWEEQYGTAAAQSRGQNLSRVQTPTWGQTPKWAQQSGSATPYGQPPSYAQPQSYGNAPRQGYAGRQTALSQYNAQNSGQYYRPQTTPPIGLRGESKPSWLERMGFGNVETSFTGHARLGVAGVARSNMDTKAESIVDLDARFEASAITEGGLEYGVGLRARAQRDRYRRGFGGRVGDCPATDPACTSVIVGGTTRPVKGHTAQFYTSGPDDRRETELALEGAYVFLRSGYGDVVIGRDDGVASLFSLGAPSLVAVNASNSPVDYTGLDSVKTWNDASGFAEKLSYTSPRLLGDQIGIGLQFGLSYAPNARACGVDYCVKKNPSGANDPFAPKIENIVEGAVSLDRTFSNGLHTELTATYAHGSENSHIPGFASLNSYGLGFEAKYADLDFGTSYLRSNNGFAGQGNYTAWDTGLTWKPNNWGFSASYGHADDDIAKLTSNQAVLALSYDLGKLRLGTGVQYISRDVPVLTATGRSSTNEKATAVFVEVGTDF